MAIWYDGNKNLSENRHEENGVVYFVRGVTELEDIRYERYAVQTHFIERGESYVELIKKYILPLYKAGDIVSISEKIVSMCQNNTVEKAEVKLGFFAKTLSKFATTNNNGIGMSEPYKLQLAINMKGLPLVLWATFCAAVARVFGKRGVFYEIVGQDVAGIDGFYSHSAFDVYHDLAVLNPREPDKVCAEIREQTGVSCMIVDANDIDIQILGASPDLADEPDTRLIALIGDNPAGQDDELTPLVLIRNIGDAPAMPYTPVKEKTDI